MAEAEELVETEEVGLRVTDGKWPEEAYSAEVIRRARLAWCLYGNDRQVETDMELRPGIVKRWRDKKAPDGRDWVEVQAQLGIASVDQLLEVTGPQDLSDHCRQMVRWGLELLGSCVAVLRTYAYFTAPPDDPKRKRVRWLYDQEGNKIRMTGMKPTNFHHLVLGMREAAKIADVHLEWGERLQTLEAQRRMDIARITQLLANAIDETLGLDEEDRIRYRRALAVTGERIARATLEEKAQQGEQDGEGGTEEAFEAVGADPADLPEGEESETREPGEDPEDDDL